VLHPETETTPKLSFLPVSAPIPEPEPKFGRPVLESELEPAGLEFCAFCMALHWISWSFRFIPANIPPLRCELPPVQIQHTSHSLQTTKPLVLVVTNEDFPSKTLDNIKHLSMFIFLLFTVYEKEREWGHDPQAPEDTPFGEYMRK